MMEGISGIGGLSGGVLPARLAPAASGVQGASAVVPQASTPVVQNLNHDGTAGALSGSNILSAPNSPLNGPSFLSLSSMSITAGSEVLIVSEQQPLLASNELIGLVLLLLTLEYMQSNDDQEKKGLLDLMTLLASQQSQGGGSSMLMYSSSFMSIESTQLTAMSMDGMMNAYTGGGAPNTQQVVPADAGYASGGLNVIA